jgi:hypothetical protein
MGGRDGRVIAHWNVQILHEVSGRKRVGPTPFQGAIRWGIDPGVRCALTPG